MDHWILGKSKIAWEGEDDGKNKPASVPLSAFQRAPLENGRNCVKIGPLLPGKNRGE
jgi:hypothetical protein